MLINCPCLTLPLVYFHERTIIIAQLQALARRNTFIIARASRVDKASKAALKAPSYLPLKNTFELPLSL